MESDYDRKFKEMKQYIPFLESMIKRLESTSTPSANPRQAQLDKIRSLRDLLLDKKKRMKMENLLKCEQVLINLYAKVEQRDDTLPGIRKASEPLFPSDPSIETQKADLNSARSKLKTVAAKSNFPENDPVCLDPDTLPEIAPAGETEVVCTPGSKEPALFQRRPNKNSLSPLRTSQAKDDLLGKKSPQKIVPKRNYTRVLVSPEPSSRRWAKSENPSDEPLFSRRSPRKSPKRHSPTQKKEKKKSSKPKKSKDLNITLNVPDEISLNSLNTTDIISRIINCPDNDVDIDTLRDLRTQILGELEQSGAKFDLSKLKLKPYKKKKSKNKQKIEVEEGELSNSESEVIETIYGSLPEIDKVNTNVGQSTIAYSNNDKQSQKIQICFTINSDKEEANNPQNKGNIEVFDLEMFDDQKNKERNETTDAPIRKNHQKRNKNTVATDKKSETVECKDSDSSYISISSSDTESQLPESKILSDVSNDSFKPNFYNEQHKEVEKSNQSLASSNEPLQSNDTAELNDKSDVLNLQDKSKSPEKAFDNNNAKNVNPPLSSEEPKCSTIVSNDVEEKEKSVENVEIPLLNTEPAVQAPVNKDVVSEIDILQALKNEILSENIAIPGSEIGTPLLHQPKVTKVASAHEIISKKRISIEKYKEKTVSTPKVSLFIKNQSMPQSHDNSKKTSLKLTEQEQQRFNIPPSILDDSSDEEDKQIEDIYEDFAPKSPENSDITTGVPSVPIIIPVEPIKPPADTSKTDVDMRTLVPLMSPNTPKPVTQPSGIFSASITKKTPESGIGKHNEKQIESRSAPLVDPRMRRDLKNSVGKDSPISYGSNPEKTPRHSGNFSGVAPNMNPKMTPRSFEMTPSRQSLDFEDSSSRKHVYAPFLALESREYKEQSVNIDHGPRWELNPDTKPEECNSSWNLWKDTDLRNTGSSRKWDDCDQRGRSTHEGGSDYHKSGYGTDKRYSNARNDIPIHEHQEDYAYKRMDCPRTPVHNFGRSDYHTPTPPFGRVETPVNPFSRHDCPTTPNPSFGRVETLPFGRGDCPIAPNHQFGRSECPTTPIHPFGRNDCPLTPNHPFGCTEVPLSSNHPFGRTEAPMTPSHPFGRSEAPMTPSHSFGRSEAPMTPSHSFGRSEAPMTPSHSFGRSEAPMTPSHSFGRSEAPMTPSHCFGRSEAPMTPSHQFGRSDYQQISGPKVKDPRLTRNTEYKSSTRKFDEERDRRYYKDGRKSDLSLKNYNSPESCRNYKEQSVGRRDGVKVNRQPTPGRESSVGRILQSDYENDRLYTRDRSGGRSNDYRRDKDKGLRNYNEVGQRGEYQRSHSVGRAGPAADRFLRSSSRGPTDRNYEKLNSDNTLSVKSQSGRSFTIDTSVNTTFQEFLNGKGLQVFDYSFDSRRSRASSVGRTLTRESSVGRNMREGSLGRTLSKPSYSAAEDTSGYKNMVNFVRARSMGRELVDKTEKSFNEIKADLKSCKVNYYTVKKTDKNVLSVKKSNYCDPRSRKELHEKKVVKKTSPQTYKKTGYSPRKNYRDPRMNREQYNDSKNRSRYEDKKKTYGIVYSNDNIAKGTILGTGYGVKNYKIPKIKKPVEETVPREDASNFKSVSKKESILPDKMNSSESKGKETEGSKKDKETASKSKKNVTKEKSVLATEIKNERKTNKVEKKVEQEDSKRSSRRSKLNEPLESTAEYLTKSRKSKKAIIDSDSDTEAVVNEKCKNETLQTSAIAADLKNEKSINEILQTSVPIESDLKDEKNKNDFLKTSVPKASDLKDEKNKNDLLKTSVSISTDLKDGVISTEHNDESSFSIGDLEIFPDTLNNDPGLDNINALIADLDNDLDTTKANDFMKDISFDNMFDNIDSPEGNMEESLKNISNEIKNCEQSANQNCENGSVNKEIVDQNNVKPPSENIDGLPKIQELQSPKEDENKSMTKESDSLKENPAQEQSNDSTNAGNVLDNTVNNSNHLYKETYQNILASINSESAVSTSESVRQPIKKSDELNEDRPSTPDSTLNTGTVVSNKSHYQDSLPDSTNEKSDEMHPDVTSTLERAGTSFQTESSTNSIGNFLSIFNKTKIKEVLSLLGEFQSSDNEKIKKKLEKLSEIVSDDDETGDGIKFENNDKEHQPNEIDINPEITDKSNTEISNEDPVASDNITLIDDKIINERMKNVEGTEQAVIKKKTAQVKKAKSLKRGRKRKLKSDKHPLQNKRITRSGAASKLLQQPKKASRELRQLHESIKEMFMKDDVLNATGIRLCRLAKLVDEKAPQKEEPNSTDSKPVVRLEKIKDNANIEQKKEPKLGKNPRSKPKPANEDNISVTPKDIQTTSPKYKPGPKSKTKIINEDLDRFPFDGSVSEATTAHSEQENESETEDESLASLSSFSSSEVLADLKKKPKRKKRGKWQSGIIKKKRKKNESKQSNSVVEDADILLNKDKKIPDMNCFTDKTYCFFKNVSEYPCRLCEYNGPEIVKHYKTVHPHTEIPLSRMNAVVAREAVEQCEDINFQAISKMPTEKYVCRFCFDEFGRKQNVLEEFFWHVVSMHTGEYKRLCSECVNVTRCPFNLDIPPPPKDLKGQLIGYICGKCNFTQISLENLKTHVIVRHNDEQTAVYTINLAVMNKKTMQMLMKRCNTNEPRALRSLRPKLSSNKTSEPSNIDEDTGVTCDVQHLKIKPIKQDDEPKSPVYSKIVFENDENVSETTNSEVKVEREDIDNDNKSDSSQYREPELNEPDTQLEKETDQSISDIFDYPHFKICYTSFGIKEYVCCILGSDNHYTTNLLISLKKHVQTKHSEIWDGYCSICKVIVMPQGGHRFKECLQHMLDKHMDNFPVIEKVNSEPEISSQTVGTSIETHTRSAAISEVTASPQTYINVRPIKDLITSSDETTENAEAFPKIQHVVSLGTTTNEPRSKTPSDPAPAIFKCSTTAEKVAPQPEKPYKYEEMQAEVMSKKHLAILESMLTEDKLVQIFKCAGRYCSFTTDSVDAALLHASTHQRIGGENTLLCSYCDFDCKGNAIDLVMHVFKVHGRCPFVCKHCFYRAVASQLVLAHIHRIHGGTGGVVLQTATVTPGDDDSLNVLPREVAVQHYVCVDSEKTCKYKTYTQGSFAEHLTRHTAPYFCYQCSLETNHPMDLLNHLKTHGLKLYQCTWCVEGGDNEGDFLAHTSARHPTRQPQAYLRITTLNRKDGASKTMVLPLAKLNKSNVNTRLVTPQNNANDPAREAVKALDMEKLIASMPTLSSEITRDHIIQPDHVSTVHISPQVQTDNSTIVSEAAVLDPVLVPRLATTLPSNSVEAENELLPLTPVLKTEPIDEGLEKDLTYPNVICLDSDEEDTETPRSKPNVIDVSDEDLTSTTNPSVFKKLDRSELFECFNCSMKCRNSNGFKRHINSCFFKDDKYRCAHCEFSTNKLDMFIKHHLVDHTADGVQDPDDPVKKPIYFCGECNRADKTSGVIRNHIRKDHGLINSTVTSKLDGNYIIIGTTRGKSGPKRKLSGASVPEISPKRIRYGAQDLKNLPQKPILDDLAYCSECEFSTKVRLNLVRHIQQHADNADTLVPQTAPVNPVPHLETNEKHFDKMINLASSSFELGRTEKLTPSVTLHIPAEAASRYPKYVPERQRHTCGAKGCSYISVDETMLKRHWETLHAGSNDFHCVHCPPFQHLDTSLPLTASRIIAHLKMHDIRLYACSACPYYHYRKQVVEKHLAEVHKGSGQLVIVREESTNNSSSAVITQPSNTAPTMDLKPWKCGLCAFKSMLRPEVIEHCFKTHSTKMQFKCPVCPFRTSTLENVTKHQNNSHPGNNEDVFYYYYREGSIPDEPDGTPRWMKQRQKMGTVDSEVKTEKENVEQNPPPAPLLPALATATTYDINLDIVKEEIVEPNEEPTAILCKKFGDICDPNGLKYKCPLCDLVTEDNKEAMQSHLYEELQYRKWACSICCYKAFHKIGLNEHMVSEHRQQRAIEPIELDADTSIETWVNKVLDHQATLIETYKANLDKQKMQVEKTAPSMSETVEKAGEPSTPEGSTEKDTKILIKAFGPLGASNNTNFSCPKCIYQTADESAMKDHLEIELNKIRWRCSGCWRNAQNYHEAQLHTKTCTSSRPGQASRPVEAVRDPSVRAAWLAAVIRSQKLAMKQGPDPEPEKAMEDVITWPPENSLLVVRYEETVPTPEEEMISRRNKPVPAPSAAASPDSDDERLVIDEPSTDEADTPKKNDPIMTKKCSYCSYATRYQQQLDYHLLRHYNLRPLTCVYCEQTFYNYSMESHTLKVHPDKPKRFIKTLVPSGPPLHYELPNNKKGRKRSSSTDEMPKTKEMKPCKEEVKKDEGLKLICLVCERPVPESDTRSHTHDKPTYFAKKGEVVIKCCICLSLFPNINLMQDHNIQNHPNIPINYAYYKINHNSREVLQCGHCNKRFQFFRDLKTHHNTVHSALQLKYESRPYHPGAYDFECETENKGETSKTNMQATMSTLEPPKAVKRVAKKSTSKLPRNTVARKSTTKLPFYPDSESDSEYSYYGNKSTPLDKYENVTTRMPIFNTVIPLQKLGEIIKINPVVLVKDCKSDLYK